MKFIYKYIVALVITLTVHTVNGQKLPPMALPGSIAGPQEICLNTTYTYTYSDDLPSTYYWAVTGGVLLTTNTAGVESVNVKWTSNSGSVQLWNNGTFPASLSMTYSINNLRGTLVENGTSNTIKTTCPATVDIKINSLWGTISGWQKRVPGGTWVSVSLTTITANSVYRTQSISSDTDFRAIINSSDGGNCVQYSSVFSVKMINSISGAATIEEGEYADLSLDNVAANAINYWEQKPFDGTTWTKIPLSEKVNSLMAEIVVTSDIRAVMPNVCGTSTYSSIKRVTVVPFNTESNSVNITDENFIKSYSIKVGGITSTTTIPGLTSAQNNKAISYGDGLGRNIQSIGIGATVNDKDLVVFNNYEQSLQPKNYLPYEASTNNGTFQADPKTNQSAFYSNGITDKVKDDSKPYSIGQLEASPLGRVLKNGAPGLAWQLSKPIQYAYRLNTTTDKVRQWKANGTTNSTYGANQLYKNEVIDEQQNHVVTTFTDKMGRTILERKILSPTDFLETYYVYDEKGRLIYMIPPRAIQIIGITSTYDALNSNISSLIFTYSYDGLGRLVEKKTPDAGIEYIVYDQLDRPVMIQDANLRTKGKWAFIKYDKLSRQVLTGWINDSRTRIQMQSALDALNYNGSDKYFEETGTNATFQYYTNQAFPILSGTYKILNVSYFDDYDFNNDGSVDGYTTYVTESLTGEDAQSFDLTGLMTGSVHNIIGTTIYESKSFIYNKKGQLIQELSNNSLVTSGRQDRQTMVYNFDGSIHFIKKTVKTGATSSDLLTVLNTFIYDHGGRLESIKQKNNLDAEREIARYEYNSLGQLVDKKLHVTSSSQYLQSVDYRYNIRGWLESINSSSLATDPTDHTTDLFGLELLYNTTQSGVNITGYFNGNISAVKWKEGSTSAAEKKYNYSYDKQNRLSSALYSGKSVTWGDKESNGYNVESITYDKQGNILTLKRYAWQDLKLLVDNLTYTYNTNSNKLKVVNDAAKDDFGFEEIAAGTEEYTYDEAGNNIKDDNKGISNIIYNELNKVGSVIYSDGKQETYIYNALGQRLSRTISDGTNTSVTSYVKGAVYIDGKLDYFEMPEGRVYNKSTSGISLRYEYYIKDHQGNIRMTLNSAPEPLSFTATMETEVNVDESQLFKNLHTRVPMTAANHTPGGNEAAKLNSTSPIGPSIALEVNAGDKVNAEVWAYYSGTTTSTQMTTTQIVSALAAAFSGGTMGGGGEMLNAGLSEGVGGISVGSSNPNGVTASINILIFDKNFNYLKGSISNVSTASNGAQSKITLPAEMNIDEAGYAVIYVSNATGNTFPVYFDDLKVTYTPGPILQTNSFYPFGMVHSGNSYRGVNPRMYNGGSEQQPISGNYSTYFREYDAALGRFMATDVKAGMFASESPYHYSGNDPINNNDPLGDRYDYNRMEWESGVTQEYYMSLSNGVYGGGGGLSLFGGTSGPGSGNHWSDHYRSIDGNAALMGINTFQSFYGIDKMSGEEKANFVADNNLGVGTSDPVTIAQIVSIWKNEGSLLDRKLGNLIKNGKYIFYEVNGFGDMFIPGTNILVSSIRNNVHNRGANGDFLYDNNGTIGLGIAIIEPGFGAAMDAVLANPNAYSNGAKILGKVGGPALVGANVALTGYTVYQEKQNGQFNTHSYVNMAVTGISTVVTGIGIAIATGAIVVTSPAWGAGLVIGGAAVGVGYGVAQLAGIDGWIDRNWGFK